MKCGIQKGGEKRGLLGAGGGQEKQSRVRGESESLCSGKSCESHTGLQSSK